MPALASLARLARSALSSAASRRAARSAVRGLLCSLRAMAVRSMTLKGRSAPLKVSGWTSLGGTTLATRILEKSR